MQTVHDPVCGSSFPWDEARGIYRYRGRLYYFCSARCHSRFSNRPGAFLKGENLKLPTGNRAAESWPQNP